ncbi:MAG: hypothetical protein FJ387_10175 [Verrucomicrobia bacterium]|nr:hypothetical protein [Verrucomicrobiota bacterium]
MKTTIACKPSRRRFLTAGVCGALVGFLSPLAAAGTSELIWLQFDTSLTSLNLTGPPVGLPLVSDPGNALGDSISGYGWVNSSVTVTLSSQRVPSGPPTLGQVIAYQAQFSSARVEPGLGPPPPIDPNALHGQAFFVHSFFDVFFDITVTDVDSRPGRNIAGMPDGASVSLFDNGPASMQSSYQAMFNKDLPNFGLAPPPEVSPYIGHFNIEIPLGGDINGNGEDDKIKFTLATHAVGDANRSFIILPNGTVIDQFDSTANLEGAVVDMSTDPPFTIGGLTGPTTASSTLLNTVVPEPHEYALLAGLGLVGFAVWRRTRAETA